jgi:hypothetical protein
MVLYIVAAALVESSAEACPHPAFQVTAPGAASIIHRRDRDLLRKQSLLYLPHWPLDLG